MQWKFRVPLSGKSFYVRHTPSEVAYRYRSLQLSQQQVSLGLLKQKQKLEPAETNEIAHAPRRVMPKNLQRNRLARLNRSIPRLSDSSWAEKIGRSGAHFRLFSGGKGMSPAHL